MNKFTAGTLAIFFIATFAVKATEQEPEKFEAKMPVNVKSVIENKCFGCHNTDSRNDKAKEKLDFRTFHELQTFKKVGALRDMADVLDEGEMPPKKFLERFPDRDLTDDEREILTTWVKQEAKDLIDNQ